MRDCSTRAFGDLGPQWRREAVTAGPLAFVGMRHGVSDSRPARPGRAWRTKVLVVVEPRSVITLTIAPESRAVAALGYGARPLPLDAQGTVALADGSVSVRFVACRRANPGAERWNRGTQFPGYFLVAGRRCVEVTVSFGAPPTVLRRTLRFGAPRC